MTWVTSVSFDRSGRRIVSGSWDKTVRVWDAESGVELACLRGHDGEVTSVSFDQSGRRIVSGSWDKTVRVWDAESGVELACLRGHDDGVTSVSFDQSGRRIVSGSVDKTVRVWDAESGACMEVIQGSVDVAAIAEAGEAFRWRAIHAGAGNRDRAGRRWCPGRVALGGAGGHHDAPVRPHLGRKHGRLCVPHQACG